MDFVDTGLLTVSIWLRTINGTYIGDDLNESVDVRVSNVTLPDGVNEPDRLEVVKLDFVNGQWTWRTVDDLSSPGDLSFNGSTGEITFTVSPSVGFSVFRIVTSGFSTSGDAGDAVVYPNPFIPEDGNPETGEYGSGSRQGIHFGAGQNRGFPSGTTVKIYTIRGQQVDKITTNNGGIIRWDAHTDNGDPAASGVYIYRIETPDGSDKVGKFAIVR